MSNEGQELIVLSRLVPPMTLLTNRPYIAAFFSVHVEKLRRPRVAYMHGFLYRNSTGATKLEMFTSSTAGEGPSFAQRWNPSNREMAVYFQESGKVTRRTLDPRDVMEVWLPRSGSGPLIQFERTSDTRVIHGQECSRVRIWSPGSEAATILSEAWICEDLAIVMSDVIDTDAWLSRWEVIHLDLEEPEPESLELPDTAH